MTLAERIAGRLRDLEAESAALEARITELRALLSEHDNDGEEPAPGKARPPAEEEPRPAKGSANGKPHRRESRSGHGSDHGGSRGPTGSQIQIARCLERGPKRAGEICKELGMGSQKCAYAMKTCDLFRHTDPSNRLSSYELTEDGRAALNGTEAV